MATTDIAFLQDLFKKFVPAVISSNNAGTHNSKRPVFRGWLDVTKEQAAKLARHADYQDGPFMFITGKATKYIAIDLDKKNEHRNDHVDKVDGVTYWTNNFNDTDHANTLIIKTPSGGVHLVYKYDDKIQSGQLEKDVLIDILSDGKAICFGPGYKILNRVNPTFPPQKLVQQIIYNNSIVNYGSQTINHNSQNSNFDVTKGYSSEINAAAECNLQWDVIRAQNGKTFTLIPHTDICTVNSDHVHSETKHSRYVVSKTRVVARCFSHNTHGVITNVAAKRLRELFSPEKESFLDFMNNVMELCRDASFVRLDGFVWKARQDKPWIHDREPLLPEESQKIEQIIFCITYFIVAHLLIFCDVRKWEYFIFIL